VSASKKILFLADPFDARSVARMFERLTGKQVSEAEIDEVQKILDEARDDSTAPRSEALDSGSQCGHRRARLTPATRKPPNRVSAHPRVQPSGETCIVPASGKKYLH
jgi:hypothetical protein